MPIWRIGPADPLGLRPHLKLSSFGWLAAIAAAVGLAFVLLTAGDPDDRGEKLRDALVQNVVLSSEIGDWCRQRSPGAVLDPPRGWPATRPHRQFSQAMIWSLDLPPRRWSDRLSPPQPFSGRARLSLGERVGASCDLVVDFKAAIAGREVSVDGFDRYGNRQPGGSVRRSYYMILELTPRHE